MSEATVKMFVGIKVPKDIATSLGDFRNAHLQNLQDVRWTTTDDLHLTLKYLGTQTESSAKLIAEGLAKISQSPLDIALSDSGVFRDVGVLFISVVRAPELMRFQTTVDLVAFRNGVPPSEHPYNPHITIARLNNELVKLKSPKTLFDQIPEQLDKFCQRLPRHHFRATEMTLFKSVSGRYSLLRSFQLRDEVQQ